MYLKKILHNINTQCFHGIVLNKENVKVKIYNW